MRPFLVLLLVLAAAGGFFYVLTKDRAQDAGNPAPIGPATPQAGAPAAEPGPADLVPGAATQAKREVAPESVPPADVSTQAAINLAVGRGTVQGTVVDEGGSPIPAADVRLTRYGTDNIFFPEIGGTLVPDIKTTSGKDGAFLLENVPVYDNYALIVTHGKFSRVERSPVAVREGRATVEPRVVLGPGIGLSGRITDTGGNSVPGAIVRVSFTPFASFGSDADVLDTKSDSEGRYAFANLAPGNYGLSVVADGYGRIDVPNINIDGKEPAVKDLVLEVAFMIAGSVRTLEGAPLPEVEINAYSDSRTNPSQSQVRSDEKGEFIIQDVPQGRYLIQARLAGYEMAVNNLRVETGDMSVQVQMRALPRVRGQVVSSVTGQPIPNFTAQLRQPIQGSETATAAVPSTRGTFSDPEGRFELGVPKGGDYRVHIIAPDHADTLSSQFAVVTGTDVNNIVVRCIKGGKVRGRVVDAAGKPVVGARVSSHHKEWSDDMFSLSLGEHTPWLATEASAITDSEGRYTLSNLMPETYQIRVKHPDYAGASQTDVLVSDVNETIARDILLPVGSTVSGVVYGPNGRPLPGALVKLNGEGVFAGSMPGGPYTGRADDNGRYAIQNVKQGTYGAWAERPRGANTNPFQASMDMKNVKRTLTVTEGGTYDSEDFKLKDQ
jgi:protocatechuate 3,4-dioxygenase beta subunit